MSLTAALLSGDIVDPEDEEDDVDGPLNPTTLKQEWEKMCRTIWLLLCLLQTFMCSPSA